MSPKKMQSPWLVRRVPCDDRRKVFTYMFKHEYSGNAGNAGNTGISAIVSSRKNGAKGDR